MVKQANLSDESTVVDIITESFKNNPSVISSVKNDDKLDMRIEELARYAFRTAISRNGVLLSSNNKGVAICYHFNIKKTSFTDYWNQIRLVCKAIGISKVFTLLKREKYINKIRPKEGNYLYFWFFGVKESYRRSAAAKELKTAIFKESDDNQLPIYLETSVEQNKIVYQRFGFEIYHSWHRKDHTLWFMKRDPKFVNSI